MHIHIYKKITERKISWQNFGQFFIILLFTCISASFRQWKCIHCTQFSLSTWFCSRLLKEKWYEHLKKIEYLNSNLNKIIILKNIGLPWWHSGWESACQCRGHGFEPWSGKIPHAAEQLGPWATITEPVRLEPVLHNKGGRDTERTMHRDEEWPPLAATRESPRTETKTQHSHK